MKQYSKYVGLDVHADSIAIAVAEKGRGGEVRSLGMIPNEPAAIKRALRKVGQFSEMLVCYEAGPCGYGIYWQIEELGADCMVVAPTLIPVRSGDRVKTDRRDALKLARLLRSGELVAAWVPDRAHEALRNLVRTRVCAKRDERRAKNRLGKFLLRMGKRPTKKTKSFGHLYCQWLHGLADQFEQQPDRISFQEYYGEWVHQRDRVLRIEQHISATIEELPAEQRSVFSALCALRGVAKIAAVTALAEVGSFSRFRSPRQLMAYAGVVSAEYSSGKSTNRGAITKTGNAFLRHAIRRERLVLSLLRCCGSRSTTAKGRRVGADRCYCGARRQAHTMRPAFTPRLASLDRGRS